MITTLFDILITIIEGFFKTTFELLESAISGNRNKEYTAEFASQRSLLSSFNSGFCLTGNKNLSIKDSFQNSLIVGGTGTGKSSVILIPSLYSMKGSFIVHDPSGELFSKSSGYLKQKGYNVKVLNFACPEISSNYNPLARAKNSSTDIQKVASILVENSMGGNKKEPFWNSLAVSLITILIQILKTQEEEFYNLPNVRHLLNAMGGNHEAVDILFSEKADEKLFAEYKAFLAYDEKVRNSVIATCKAALQIFNDENVAKCTATDNIRFEDFREKPTVVYIQNSIAEQRYYSVLTSLYFEQLFSFILSRFPQKSEQNIFFLIDECSSLHLPTLALATANVRKYCAGILLIVQSPQQMTNHYGKAETESILANCHSKLYFSGQNLETASELEKILGKWEFRDEEERKVVRSLMTNDEIRMLRQDRAILISGNSAPVIAKLRPYYQNKLYRDYANIPAPKSCSENTIDSVPLLPLPVILKNDESEE